VAEFVFIWVFAYDVKPILFDIMVVLSSIFSVSPVKAEGPNGDSEPEEKSGPRQGGPQSAALPHHALHGGVRPIRAVSSSAYDIITFLKHIYETQQSDLTFLDFYKILYDDIIQHDFSQHHYGILSVFLNAYCTMTSFMRMV